MTRVKQYPLRFAGRFLGFIYLLVGAGGSFIFCYWLTGKAKTFRGRAAWLQRWSKVAVKLFGTEVEVRGQPLRAGLTVSNHLSYHDIFCLASIQPTVFVSKAEVANWPVFGWFARIAGTLFLKREQRSDVARIVDQLREPIEEGLAVVMFLEGTSTGGDRVLPFRSSLLEPAAEQQWPVTPQWIGYTMREGRVEEEVAYWRDMTLFPHMMNLLAQANVTAQIAVGAPIRHADRKQLAQQLHQVVCALPGEFGRTLTAGASAGEQAVNGGE
jgi:1-acyl-sn-glycerol-3-phosphate acyltransferase